MTDTTSLAAELLERLSPQPPADGEWRTGLPPFAGFYYVRGLLDESIGGDCRAVYVTPEHFVWGFSQWDDPEWIGLDSDITPENIQWKPAGSTPQPIPVSERLPGAGDCDAEGMCWWWFAPAERWIRCGIPEPNPASEIHTHWLPAHALPVPTPEPQP